MIEARHRRLAWMTGSVLAVSALLGALACQQILSIDGTVTSCKLVVPPGDCQSCVASSCCSQAAACADDPGCSAYEGCILACGSDYACRAACVQNGVGIATSDAVPVLDTCIVANCETACGTSCGAQGSYANPDAAQDCQQCIIAHGCAVGDTCGKDLECEKIGHCAIECATDDCLGACQAAHPDAGAEFVAVAYGLGIACLNTCSVGNEWGCVGKISMPLAKSPNITLMLQVIDGDAPNGAPGLTVKACIASDFLCAAPLVSGTTDAQGSVVLAFPTLGPHAFGFNGYFDIEGPGIVHSLYFLNYPLSEPQPSLQVTVLTPAHLASLRSGVQITAPDGGTAPFVADDVNRSTIVVGAGDCHHQGAVRTTLTAVEGADPLMVERYVEGSTLSNTATVTDHSGLVFFLNTPIQPTEVRVEATPEGLGQVSSKAIVFGRPGVVSFIHAYPGS